MISSIFDSQLLSIHKSATHPQLSNRDFIYGKHLKHRVLKRDTSEAFNEVSFGAFGRQFKLILNQNNDLLSPLFRAFAVDSSGVKTEVGVDKDEFYTGQLVGSKSSVDAHIDRETGVLTASIHNEDTNETYFVEPYWRHAKEDGNHSAADPNSDVMLIYKASDVIHSWTLSGTESNKSIHNYCDYIKIPEEVPEQRLVRKKRNVPNGNYWFPDEHISNFNQNTRCSLLLVADYLFYEEMGGKDLKKTISFLIALVGRVNTIYLKTNFTDDNHDKTGLRGMGFLIQEVLVHEKPTHTHAEHYNMNRRYWKVRDLLEVFSREQSHDSYCLAHLFTHRKFDNAVLGLAYVASPKPNSVGGICSPGYYKNGYTLYLNSGLTTTKNTFNLRVITREADLVTAHEFGHNWGAEHDPDLKECSPSSKFGGAYVMYTFSVSGYDPNNKLFSPCSRRSIKAVLKSKADRCFLRPRTAFCGNGLVEGNEECDAGVFGSQDSDKCCSSDCTLKPGAQCSDKNSPCCYYCRYVTSDVKCRDGNALTCKMDSYCSPNSAVCPKSDPQPDGTDCLDKGKCYSGSCQPFCEANTLFSCMCDTVKDACKRCCRSNPSINSTCAPFDHREFLQDGTPCKFGLCEKGVCIKRGREMVRRFWKIIHKADVSVIAKFLKDNIVGVIILISAFLWIPASYAIDAYDKKVKVKVYQQRSDRRRSKRSVSQQRQVVLACQDIHCDPVSGFEDPGFHDTFNLRRPPTNRNQRPYYTTYAAVADPSRRVRGFRPRVVHPPRGTETEVVVETRNGHYDEVDDESTSRPILSTEL